MKVTFIGLGKMGMPMAANLVRGEGIELTVVNRGQAKVAEMVVCLCLRDEAAV